MDLSRFRLLDEEEEELQAPTIEAPAVAPVPRPLNPALLEYLNSKNAPKEMTPEELSENERVSSGQELLGNLGLALGGAKRRPMYEGFLVDAKQRAGAPGLRNKAVQEFLLNKHKIGQDAEQMAWEREKFGLGEGAKKAAAENRRQQELEDATRQRGERIDDLKFQAAEAERRAHIMAGARAAERLPETVTNLRKEFDALPEVKEFKAADANLASMTQYVTAPSAAGDIALAYSFIKMQDPGSTVGTGELASVSNAGGVSEAVRNYYNKALRGERLTPEQRADFFKQAKAIHSSKKAKRDATARRYQGLGKKAGGAAEDVAEIGTDGQREPEVVERRLLEDGRVIERLSDGSKRIKE